MDKQTIKCPVCGNEVTINEPDEKFCPFCGTPLFNECSNYSCQRQLAPNEAYCKYCGSPSTFLNLGILKSAKPTQPVTFDDSDDLPF